MSLKGVSRLDGLEESHAVAEEILFGKLLGEDNLGGNEDRELAGTVWRRDFNESFLVIPCPSLEAQASTGDVFALHQFILAVGMAHQGDVIDFDPRILTAIHLRNIGYVRRRRHGQNGSGGSSGGGGSRTRNLYGQRGGRCRLSLSKIGRTRLFQLPKCRTATAFAVTQNSSLGGADVRFEAGIVNFLEGLAGGADEAEHAEFLFARRSGRKFCFPEFQLRVEEGNTVREMVVCRVELTHNANISFLVLGRPAQDKLLLGRKLVFGNNAGAVQAE